MHVWRNTDSKPIPIHPNQVIDCEVSGLPIGIRRLSAELYSVAVMACNAPFQYAKRHGNLTHPDWVCPLFHHRFARLIPPCASWAKGQRRLKFVRPFWHAYPRAMPITFTATAQEIMAGSWGTPGVAATRPWSAATPASASQSRA